MTTKHDIFAVVSFNILGKTKTKNQCPFLFSYQMTINNKKKI